jgi:hypothetical protein
MLVYYATVDEVQYIDCQGYDGAKKKGQAIFMDITQRLRFAGIRDGRITSNTFSPVVFYIPMGPMSVCLIRKFLAQQPH